MKRRILILFFSIISIAVYCQTNTNSEYDYGKSGIGFEFGPCTGLYWSINDVNDIFCEECIANVGIIIPYNRFQFIPRMGGVSSTLNKSLDFGENWNQKNNFGSMNLELATAFELIDTKLFSFLPYINIGSKAFNTFHRADSISENTNFTFNWGIGCAFDFKLHSKIKEKNKFPGSDFVIQYWMLRIITGVNPNYYQNPLQIDAGIYYINISIGGMFKPSRKIQ